MTGPRGDLSRGQFPATSPTQPAGPTLLGLLSLLEPQYRWTRKTFFGYVTEFLTLGVSATVTNQVGIQSDSDFLITYATCIVTDTTNLIQLPFIPQLVQLYDSAAGVSFFLLPEHAMNVYGDAMNPGIFAIPYVMRAASTLGVQHQNLEATARNVRCAFNGFRSYPGTDTRDPKWQTR